MTPAPEGPTAPRLLRVVVVEDEPSSRRELVEMLRARDGVRVVGESGDLASAVELLEDTPPDVVFLDIRLRGRSGFHLLPHLPAGARTVFVTAYEEHAVRAFEVDAVDYLLKPVTDDRLDQALDRLRAGSPTGLPGDPGSPGGGASRARPEGPGGGELSPDDHLFLRLDSSWGFLRVGEIRCILADGDYTRVVRRSGDHSLVSKTMGEWERRLPESRFLRIHRSTLVNLEEVARVEDRRDGSCRVFLRGAEEPLSMSRRYAARIRERLG